MGLSDLVLKHRPWVMLVLGLFALIILEVKTLHLFIGIILIISSIYFKNSNTAFAVYLIGAVTWIATTIYYLVVA